jgi:hypothetical protein
MVWIVGMVVWAVVTTSLPNLIIAMSADRLINAEIIDHDVSYRNQWCFYDPQVVFRYRNMYLKITQIPSPGDVCLSRKWCLLCCIARINPWGHDCNLVVCCLAIIIHLSHVFWQYRKSLTGSLYHCSGADVQGILAAVTSWGNNLTNNRIFTRAQLFCRLHFAWIILFTLDLWIIKLIIADSLSTDGRKGHRIIPIRIITKASRRDHWLESTREEKPDH